MAKNLWPQRLIELNDVAPIRFPEVLPGSALVINATKDGFVWSAQGGAGPSGPQGDIGPAGPPNILTIGSVTKGEVPSATIDGTSPEQVLSLVLPQGDAGTNGTNGTDGTDAVNPNFTISGVGEGPAAVALTGVYPDLGLAFTVPKGGQGDIGPAGPPNVLTVGTVIPATTAAVTITGTSPSQVINFEVPIGPPGPAGSVASAGNLGTGVQVFKDMGVGGDTPMFRTLVEGAGVTLTQGADEIIVAVAAAPVVDVTATRDLAVTDEAKYLRSSSATAVTLTMPVDLALVDPAAEIHVRQAGAGGVTIAAAGGVTINTPFGGTLVMAGQGATVTLKKVAANTYDLFGLVVPA